jgi:hypothetical protein
LEKQSSTIAQALSGPSQTGYLTCLTMYASRSERISSSMAFQHLNYAYGVLEGECRRAINAVGLEPSVGFLHEFSNYQTKQSLVYDLQEPFRWISDVTGVEAFERGALDLRKTHLSRALPVMRRCRAWLNLK